MPILKSAELLAAIKSALPAVAQGLHQEYQVGIPVDTGSLKDSQATIVTDTTITTTWESDHAVYIHEGYSRKNGSRVEGRPWTKPVLDAIETSPAIAQIAQQIQSI